MNHISTQINHKNNQEKTRKIAKKTLAICKICSWHRSPLLTINAIEWRSWLGFGFGFALLFMVNARKMFETLK